jgi:hypothetical protein
MPLVAACFRCKQLKVRCERPEGQGCTRCVRSGVQCIDGPPSQQGKRKRSGDGGGDREVTHQAMPLVTTLTGAGVGVGSLLGQCGNMASMEGSWMLHGLFATTAPPSRAALFWLLRHLAARATALNSNALFETTLRLASACSIAFSDVIRDLDQDMTEMDFPRVIGNLFKELPRHKGYYIGRRCAPAANGELVMEASKAFSEDICTVEQLSSHWKAHPQDDNIYSLFVHPDDHSVIPIAFGRILASCPTLDPSKAMGMGTTALARILVADPADGTRSFVASQVEVHFCHFNGHPFMGCKFIPIVPIGTQVALPSYGAASFAGTRTMLELEASGAVGPFSETKPRAYHALGAESSLQAKGTPVAPADGAMGGVYKLERCPFSDMPEDPTSNASGGPYSRDQDAQPGNGAVSAAPEVSAERPPLPASQGGVADAHEVVAGGLSMELTDDHADEFLSTPNDLLTTLLLGGEWAA